MAGDDPRAVKVWEVGAAGGGVHEGRDAVGEAEELRAGSALGGDAKDVSGEMVVGRAI